MLARTPITQVTSVFFAGKPAAADDPFFGSPSSKPHPLNARIRTKATST